MLVYEGQKEKFLYRPPIINIKEKYLFGRRSNLTPESSEKFLALAGNRTDDPPSSNSDALTPIWLVHAFNTPAWTATVEP